MASGIQTLPSRVSTPGTIFRTNRDTQKTAMHLEDAISRSTSGVKARQYGDPKVALETRRVLDAEQRIITAQKDNSRLQSISQRINISNSINDQVIEIAREARDRAMKATDVTSNDLSFQQFCRDRLNELEALLNRRDAEGRNLFGGTHTEGQVVDMALYPVPATGAMPIPTITPYYLGGDTQLETNLTENENLGYGFLANDPGVTEVVHWLKLGTVTNATSSWTPDDRTNLSNMVGGLGDAITSLGDIKGRLGGQLERIEDTNDANDAAELLYKEIISEAFDADIIQAIVDHAIFAAQMEVINSAQARTTNSIQQLFSIV